MTKETDPKSLPEILAALPETAWTEPRELTPSEKAMIAKLNLWARRAFGVGIARLHKTAGVDVPDFDCIEGLVSFGIQHGIRLTTEGAAIADAAHLWSGAKQADAGRLKAAEDKKRSTALSTHAILTPLQRSYLRSYFVDNELEFRFVRVDVEPDKQVFMLQESPLFHATRQALHGKDTISTEPTLQPEFDERALLQWALNHGPSLNAAGLQRVRELGLLSEIKQANAGTDKAVEPCLAAAIGAKGWADIRLVVRTEGVTFHGPVTHRALSWEKIGLGEEKAAAQTAFLVYLAKAGGYLPHSERAESTPDTGGNRGTWTQSEWNQYMDNERIRRFSELSSDKNQQNKVRANVKRLNEKFVALFPSIQGKPFKNKKGATISNFRVIEVQ